MAGATGLSSPGTGINDVSGQTFNVGVTTVTYYIEDAAGNSAQCNFTVTVVDNEDPTIVCPGNVSVNNDAGNCSAVVAIAAPTTDDNCGVTLQTWSMAGATGLSSPGTGINDVSGQTFNVGVTTVTYYIEDAAGNSAQCNFTVTVVDNEDPTIVCPGNVSVNNDVGNCSAVVNGLSPTTDDNCAVTLQTWSMAGATGLSSPGTGINDVSGQTFNVGVTTVTYFIEDAAGNSAQCNFTVTVVDNEDPTIVCPGNVSVNNDVGNCSAVVAIAAPTTDDNCAVTLQTWSMAGATGLSSPGTGINDVSGQTFNVGVTTVTYYIEDAAGNSAQCNFTVTVVDNEDPTIVCPGNVSVNNDVGNCSAVVAIAAPTTDDNCAVTLQTWSMAGATGLSSPGTGINDVSGQTFNVGVTTVTYYIEDAAGNSAQCNFTVTVVDNEDPTIVCPGNVSVNNDAGNCSAVVAIAAPTTDDNCGVTLQTWSMAGATGLSSPGTGINDVSGQTFNVGVTTVTYYIEDAAGNSAQCNFTVTVVDNEDPTIVCPGNVSVNNDVGNCSAVVAIAAPTTDDNCGVTLQTWSMAGATGLSSPGTGINDVSGQTFNVGVTTVTYYIEDAAGNSAQCNFTVTVVDNEDPTIVCPGNVSVNNDAGNCSAVVAIAAPTTDDNCGVTLQTWSMAGATGLSSPGTGINDVSGQTFNVGVTTVTYYIEDAAGNSAQCNFTVTVVDNEDPTIVCPGNVSVNNDVGNCSAVVAIAAPTTDDNCGVTLQTWSMAGATGLSSPGTGINDVSGQTFNVGVTTVTYYIEDAAGNSAQCNFTVTVVDNEDPTIVCPGNVSVNNDAGNCSAVVAIAAPTTDDNCGVTLQTWSMAGATGLSRYRDLRTDLQCRSYYGYLLHRGCCR
jgi:glucokinase